ncbi:MAG: tetratricopeptide repeat protein [Proteobacteria bacterium]|nr:tetratricopeptide repeat protein [Pseudomonadota bacterium]
MNRKDRRTAAKRGATGTAPPGGHAAPLSAALFNLAPPSPAAATTGRARPSPTVARSQEATAHLQRCIVLQKDGKLRDAATAYRSAIELWPDFAAAHINLAATLFGLGTLEPASEHARRAVTLAPNDAAAHSTLGLIRQSQGQTDEAIVAFRRAAALRPDHPGFLSNLADSLRTTGELGEAIRLFQRAIALAPNFAIAHNNLGTALLTAGQVAEAIDRFRQAVALSPKFNVAHSNLIFASNFSGDDAGAPRNEASRWYERYGRGRDDARPHANTRDPARCLRVGYVSADFRRHSCAHFLAPLFAAHDRAAVQIIAYADVRHPDDVTRRLQPLVDDWRNIAGMSETAIVELVRADGIDILVDLAGHTAGNHLLVFAAQPAPVQVSWLGYPATTGVPTIHYRLTDAIADPPDEGDGAYTDRLIRLSHGFLCFQPFDEMPTPRMPPAAEGSPVTFGSFNAIAKINDRVVAVWARILHESPGSRLLLKASGLLDGSTRERVAGEFARHGIPSERLELVGWTAKPSDHLALYNRVDIALDTFPYNGTTTTCEALWMGVPVVTRTGNRHANRVGASLLARIDLADLVCDNDDSYVARSVALACDLDRLAVLRHGLRARLAASPLCDTASFARAVEDAYRGMWREWCDRAANSPA